MCYTNLIQPSKSMNHYIGLTRMVKHIHVIVFKEFKPPLLIKIQLYSCEHIVEALMIYEYINMNTIQLVSPNN